MATEKLPEFAKNGQKNTDDLTLLDGFPVSKKPARQWFNFLFNALSLKINEVIDSKIDYSNIIDNLTTNDAKKPLSAAQGRALQGDKLDKTANAASATKLATARTINGVDFDGTSNIHIGQDSIKIPTKSDLNTYQTEGFYYSDNDSSLIVNAPNNFSFTLTVSKVAGVTQTLTNYKEAGDAVYVRGFYVGSWSEWKKLAFTSDSITGNAASATKLATARTINGVDFDGTSNIHIQPSSVQIPAYSNLNDYKSDGFYYCGSDNDALTISNTPQGLSFSLEVTLSIAPIQKITMYQAGGDNMYIRSFYAGSWSAWKKLAFTSDSIIGNAATATKLQTARNIALSGAVSGNADFDGSGNITINTVDNFSIGVNQTWQNVTESRAINTTYTNTTGRTIFVLISLARANGNNFLRINNTIIDDIDTQASAGDRISFVVPNGATYKIDIGSSAELRYWSELR